MCRLPMARDSGTPLGGVQSEGAITWQKFFLSVIVFNPEVSCAVAGKQAPLKSQKEKNSLRHIFLAQKFGSMFTIHLWLGT